MDIPQRLYHYEPFSPCNLEALLRDRRVRCSTPANLNDPWDCRPWFDAEFADNAEALRDWVEWALTLDALTPGVRTSLKNDLQVIVSACQRNPEIPKRTVIRQAKHAIQFLATYWRIYCLTARPCSTLMWSHYADNHRGICLEFTTREAPFQCAQKVVYRSEYPQWQPHILLEARIEQALLTKSDDWEYEDEYRILSKKSDAGGRAGDKVLISDDGYLTLPSDSLSSIIAGCEADCEPIAAIVARYSPGLPVRQAVREPNKYRLEIA